MKNRMMDEEQDVENVGIMQGFMDSMNEEEDDDEDEGEEEENYSGIDRRPDSPEILMNNLRGDMRSIDARRDELADLVGYAAATETPEPVLAMLQPILAGQGPAAGAGGGIGGLPPSMAMAQGPQPPMMPPPPPPMAPGAPGAEMAPPPGDGGIAALLAGAGGPPPGGAPAQPPVQMAQGGYVQRFKEGSDEDGVTPAEEPSPLGFTPSPDLVEAARQKFLTTLTQKPAAVPDLKAETAARTKLYQDIIGDTTQSRQAQLLLSLGQRAFGFAGNVDDQGRPLRGSFASRLAQAARPLPAEMSKFIAAADKEQQQARLLGLQAAEKEIADTKSANLKLLETQRKGYADILKAAAKDKDKKGAGPFGSGLEGRSLEMFVKYAPMYAKGELDADSERYFLSAVTNYTQPREIEFTDPLTGEKSFRRQQNALPDFVTTALKARGTTLPTMRGGPGVGMGAGVGAGAPPMTPVPRVGGPLNLGATPNDIPPEVAPIVEASPQSTFFDLASKGTGFVPVLISGVARNVPFSAAGRIGQEFQQATAMVENLRNRVVNVLQENPRFAEGERKQIFSELNIGPRLLANQVSYVNQLIALDNVFDTIETKTKELSENKNIGIAKRQEAYKKLEEVTNIRDLLGIRDKKISSPEVWATLPPGEYLVLDPQKKVFVLRPKYANRGQR